MEKNVLKISMIGALVLCSMACATPGWFVKTDVNQDFRYRLHEYKQDDSENGSSRYRERLRYRISLVTKIDDEFTAGARLATGGTAVGDNRSTTQTLDSDFSNKNINLDQAYLSYAPQWIPDVAGKLKFTVGKFDVKEGVYTVTNIMWDSNLTPEGRVLNYNYKDLGLKGLDIFANVGSYILAGDVRTNGTGNNGGTPLTMEGQQLGFKWKIANDYNFDAAYGTYCVPAWDKSRGTTTVVDFSDNKPVNQTSAKIGANLKVPFFEKAALLYESYENTNFDKDNKGAAAGIEFGTAKMAKLGDYSLRYLTRRSEDNVGWNLMEDADKEAGSGRGTEGSQIALTLGLAENVSFTFEQYDLKYIDYDGKPWKDTRFEVNVKF